MFFKTKSFTLAETLITIVILGIIAILIVPNLIQKNQRRILKNQLVSAYSDLEHVSRVFYITHEMSIKDYAHSKSSINYDYVSAFNDIIDEQAIKISSTKAENKSMAIRFRNGDYKTLTGNTPTYTYFDDGYIKDGKGRDWYMEYLYHTVKIDVNGFEKGPNKLGIDVFGFVFESNGEVTPSKNTSRCSATSTNSLNGEGCTYYALQNISPANSKKNYWTDFLNSVK